jgi:uncharacterized membrane protein YjfL (UPF0719 family)
MWAAKTIFLALICTLLAWLGIRVMDVLTPHIHERDKIGESPISVGLFIAGFLIFVGLVIHGATTAPAAIGGPFLEYLLDPRRLGMLAVSFLISLLVGIALFHIVDKLTPKIPFASVEKDSIAVGAYVFGYLIFFGLIIHAALSTPL